MYEKNIATFIHLSTFVGLVFPFGNFIAPLFLWIFNKDKSPFIDAHGKQAINFQISVFIYAISIALISVPFIIYAVLNHIDNWDYNNYESINVDISTLSPLAYLTATLAFVYIIGFIAEIILIVVASINARDGKLYKYPLTINFLK